MTKKILKISLSIIIIASLNGCAKKVELLERTGYANQYRIIVNSGFGTDSNGIGAYYEAVNKAREQCKHQNKKYHLVNKLILPGRIGESFSKAELIFECNNNLIDTKQKVMILDNKSLSDKLKTIEKLYKDKIISTEEYHKKRDSLLNEF